jgi:hypothetical protein
MDKITLKKDEVIAVNMFTADMENMIRSLSDVLIEIFNAFKNGECGEHVKDITLKLFNEWLTRSLLPTVEEAKKVMASTIEKAGDVDTAQKLLRKKLPTFKNIDKIVAEIMADSKRGNLLEKVVSTHIWTLYSQQTEAFCVQTAHLIVGRLLMLHVGVDKGAWKPLTVQNNLPTPYLTFYWTSRSALSEFLPTIYNLNELDWLYIPDTIKQGLEKMELSTLKFYEEKLDKYIARTDATLTKYDYSLVDVDLWKAVYQRFLPREEINKLGFVTTPDEIVDLILDLIGYKENVQGLCNKSLLDPACGSGTFLVEALLRLKKHFELDLPCHKRKQDSPTWIFEKNFLERVMLNINGIDIHPFATFLTTLNLTFQLIDVYSLVKHKYPDFSLSFNIVTHDALVSKPKIREIGAYLNSRLKEASQRSRKYAQLCDRKFDFVVGNPPWGAVLRGNIGPLGSDEKRKYYKKHFKSAIGKYDIFVLFLERGVEWLKDKGILGMITQVTYVSQAFGKGIQNVIKKTAALKYFIDLSKLGHIIFPGWTNYPAITVLQKGERQREIILVEVVENEP